MEQGRTGMEQGRKVAAVAGLGRLGVLVLVGTLVLAGCGGRTGGAPAAAGSAGATAAGGGQASAAGGQTPAGGAAGASAGQEGAGGAQSGAGVQVGGAWARAAGAGQNGAVYLRIENRGSERDRLVGVSTDVAERAELHESVMQDGVMRIRPLARGVEIGPGEVQEFKPGGRHVMLMGLRRALQVGERFAVQLQFERAGAMSVPVEVRDAAAPAEAEMSHGQRMPHGM